MAIQRLNKPNTTYLKAYKSFLKGIRLNSIALNKLDTNNLVDRNEIKLRIDITKSMLTELNKYLKLIEQEKTK
jgi:hypothetical protein